MEKSNDDNKRIYEETKSLSKELVNNLPGVTNVRNPYKEIVDCFNIEFYGCTMSELAEAYGKRRACSFNRQKVYTFCDSIFLQIRKESLVYVLDKLNEEYLENGIISFVRRDHTEKCKQDIIAFAKERKKQFLKERYNIDSDESLSDYNLDTSIIFTSIIESIDNNLGYEKGEEISDPSKVKSIYPAKMSVFEYLCYRRNIKNIKLAEVLNGKEQAAFVANQKEQCVEMSAEEAGKYAIVEKPRAFVNDVVNKSIARALELFNEQYRLGYKELKKYEKDAIKCLILLKVYGDLKGSSYSGYNMQQRMYQDLGPQFASKYIRLAVNKGFTRDR